MDGDLDGTYGKGNQIFAMDMHVHMRWISPDEMKVKTAITPFGPRYYFQANGWPLSAGSSVACGLAPLGGAPPGPASVLSTIKLYRTLTINMAITEVL
jgi:hypothetical protein